MAFNEGKTHIVTLDDGFDFLGVTVRRQSGKLLIKPSKAAVRRIRERLKTEMRALRGSNAQAVIHRLNPIIRGWSAYYRSVVSSEIFTALDDYIWKLTYKWARHGHPNKPKQWVISRYFGRFNKSRQNRWVFGDRDSGAYLVKFAWAKIVRHQMVNGRASPDDPALAEYWANRRRTGSALPTDRIRLRLLKAQSGHCPLCGELLLHADHPPQSPSDWEQWLVTTRMTMLNKQIVLHVDRAPDDVNLRLTHADCQRQHYAARGSSPALLHVSAPSRLA